MDNELKNILWTILAADVIIVMIAIMHHMPKPPVM